MIVEDFDKNSELLSETKDYISTTGLSIPEARKPYLPDDSTLREVRELINQGLIAESVTVMNGNFTHISTSDSAKMGNMWGMYSAVKRADLLYSPKQGESGTLYLLFSEKPEVVTSEIDTDKSNPNFRKQFMESFQNAISTDPNMEAMREKLSAYSRMTPKMWDFITSKIKAHAEPPKLFAPRVQVCNYGELVTTSLTFISLRQRTLFDDALRK